LLPGVISFYFIMSFAKLYRIFYLISLILITLGFMEYSAKSFS